MTPETRIRAAVDELVSALIDATIPAPAPPAPPVELLSVGEFARRAGLGRSSAWLAIADGTVGSVKIHGRRIVPSSEIDRLAASAKPAKRP